MSERVAEGDILAGKYRVESVIGSGGMGVVVAARHVQLDVLVALKFMTDEARADEELAARFQREARAAARLRSEHVARVSDVGTLESGAPYLVMEYLEGSDLSALLSREGPQPIARAVDFVVQACDALDEAHRAGIVHRDIKPSNLFLTTRPNGSPCIKVLDFGISKVVRLGSPSAKLRTTEPRGLLGSPFYMAPEQMRAARDLDARADIWSLGATLYELLTGRLPFEAESLLDLTFNVANVDPASSREFRAEIPWVLDQIILRCLQKDPDDRFAGAAPLATALTAFLAQRDASERRAASNEAWLEDAGGPRSDNEPTCVHDPIGVDAAAAHGSVPPVAQSKAAVFPADARPRSVRVSWLLDKKAQTTLGLFALGFLLASGSLGAILAKSQPGSGARDTSVPFGAATAAVPAASSGVLSDPSAGLRAASEEPQSGETARPANSSTQIPTLAVTDLPPSPIPEMLASPLRLPPPPYASSNPPASARPNCDKPYDIDERGHMRFKLDCLESALAAPAADAAAGSSGLAPDSAVSRNADSALSAGQSADSGRPSSSCVPPYTTDLNGGRTYKPNCINDPLASPH